MISLCISHFKCWHNALHEESECWPRSVRDPLYLALKKHSFSVPLIYATLLSPRWSQPKTDWKACRRSKRNVLLAIRASNCGLTNPITSSWLLNRLPLLASLVKNVAYLKCLKHCQAPGGDLSGNVWMIKAIPSPEDQLFFAWYVLLLSLPRTYSLRNIKSLWLFILIC